MFGAPAFLWGMLLLQPGVLSLFDVGLGSYLGIYIAVLVLCQLMGLGLFPWGYSPSQKVLCSPGPQSAEQQGMLWKILFCKLSVFLVVSALSCGRPK